MPLDFNLIASQIKELLRSLPDDETRVEVLHHIGFCLACGGERPWVDQICHCQNDE